MQHAVKSEIRKLLTVRSTYFITAVALLFTTLGAFYGAGYKALSYDKMSVTNTVTGTATLIALLLVLVAVLLMAHEYRYNTITYTLTQIRSRSVVLVAKIVAVLLFSTVLSVVMFGYAVAMLHLGVAAAGHTLPAQQFDAINALGTMLFYCGGFAMAALLVTVLVRNLTASVAIMFLAPSAIENVLSLVLRDNTKYLPFHALQQVIGIGGPGQNSLTPGHAAAVFSIYLVVGWSIAWWLFLRRDAN